MKLFYLKSLIWINNITVQPINFYRRYLINQKKEHIISAQAAVTSLFSIIAAAYRSQSICLLRIKILSRILFKKEKIHMYSVSCFAWYTYY